MTTEFPLVGDRQRLNTLYDEYCNPVIRHKIHFLAKKFSHWRPIRGDGNCFYRAIAISFLEYLVSKKDQPEGQQMIAHFVALYDDHFLHFDSDSHKLMYHRIFGEILGYVPGACGDIEECVDYMDISECTQLCGEGATTAPNSEKEDTEPILECANQKSVAQQKKSCSDKPIDHLQVKRHNEQEEQIEEVQEQVAKHSEKEVFKKVKRDAIEDRQKEQSLEIQQLKEAYRLEQQIQLQQIDELQPEHQSLLQQLDKHLESQVSPLQKLTFYLSHLEGAQREQQQEEQTLLKQQCQASTTLEPLQQQLTIELTQLLQQLPQINISELLKKEQLHVLWTDSLLYFNSRLEELSKQHRQVELRICTQEAVAQLACSEYQHMQVLDQVGWLKGKRVELEQQSKEVEQSMKLLKEAEQRHKTIEQLQEKKQQLQTCLKELQEKRQKYQFDLLISILQDHQGRLQQKQQDLQICKKKHKKEIQKLTEKWKAMEKKFDKRQHHKQATLQNIACCYTNNTLEKKQGEDEQVLVFQPTTSCEDHEEVTDVLFHCPKHQQQQQEQAKKEQQEQTKKEQQKQQEQVEQVEQAEKTEQVEQEYIQQQPQQNQHGKTESNMERQILGRKKKSSRSDKIATNTLHSSRKRKRWKQDQGVTDTLVRLFRHFTSKQLELEKDTYQFYLPEFYTIETRIDEIDTMGNEAEMLEIMLLTTFLGVGVEVLHLDREKVANGKEIVSYQLPSDTTSPKLFLLFRPGHYDVLYTHKRSTLNS